MSDARLEVARISTLAAFEAERARWEELERTDAHATVFSSWRWLRAYLPLSRLRWSVLVLREQGRAVAYLPLALGGSLLDRELYLGGNPHADYTGMIALPSHEQRAIAAFADTLARERWDAFNVRDVWDPRVEAVVERLVDRGFQLAATDETRCLSVALPATWDEYVKTKVSTKTRVNMVRVERRLAEAFPNFRVSEATPADAAAHADATVVVHHDRWGGSLRSARLRYGNLFKNAYDLGVVRLFVYWNGAEPIAGAAAFVDDLRSSFGLYMIGFDERYAKFSPGKGIVGRSIRAAIESGYQRFDFLRGDEDFKANYADEVHATRHFRITPPGLRSAAIAYARPKLLSLKLAVADLVYRRRDTA